MRKKWRRIFGTAALAFMVSLTGLVMSGTTFAQRCMDNGDGTITDNVSGLMWQRYHDGPTYYDHAIQHVSGLSLGGYSDWRLPTYFEFLALYRSECKNIVDMRRPYWAVPFAGSYTAFNFFSRQRIDVNKWSDFYVRGVRAGR